MAQSGTTYKDAGVDIDAASLFVQMIADRAGAVWSNVDLGNFSGRVRFPEDAKECDVSVDGAGTKTFLAGLLDRHYVVGIDAVAMAAVDTYMSGTRPAAILDYIVTEHLEPEVLIKLIDGIIEGCKRSMCVLIGGETAEHPSVGWPKGCFDVGVFCIGFPDPKIRLNPRENIIPGMKLWGWLSYGLGSNGFSMARKIYNLRYEDGGPEAVKERLQVYHDELGTTLGDALLAPTQIYIVAMEEQRKHYGINFIAHAHITGGGLIDNPPRILPRNCVAEIDLNSWKRPPIFKAIQEKGGVSDLEMYRTFNMGVQVMSVTDSDAEINHPDCVCIGCVRERVGDEPQVSFIR